jgi:hypothetical protein
MKRAIAIAVLAGLMTLTGQAALGSEKQMFEELSAQNKNLTIKIKKSEQVKKEIAQSEQTISGAQSALNHAAKELRLRGIGLVDEGRDIKRKADQAGCPWGTSSTDKAFVAACNNEGRRLMDLFADVEKRGAGLADYARELEKTQTRLSDSTIDLAKKRTQNEKDLQGLYDERADWQRAYNELVFKSSTYERLKKTAPAAGLCESISAPMTDQALQRAADCLNHLWDGAR